MMAQILTLGSEFSTQDIVKNISYVIDDFKGKVFVEKISNPFDDYYALFSDKKLTKEEASIVFKALETVRQFERDKDFMEEGNKNQGIALSEEILEIIRKRHISKLPKMVELMNEMINQYC